MKSSCSARGLSGSQNLPEIALILSVSLSSRHSRLPSLALFILIRPTTPPLSLPFTLLICIHLSLYPLPVPSMSSVVSVSTSGCFALLLFAISVNLTKLTYNNHYFCQYLPDVSSSHLQCHSGNVQYHFYSCLCVHSFFPPLCYPNPITYI